MLRNVIKSGKTHSMIVWLLMVNLLAINNMEKYRISLVLPHAYIIL